MFQLCRSCPVILSLLMCSLPDPVPLEKDGNGDPIRIDIPRPMDQDDHLNNVSCHHYFMVKEIGHKREQ